MKQKTIIITLNILLSLFLLASCKTKELNLSKNPRITSLSASHSSPFGTDLQTLKIVFEDGDGDVGLTSEERTTPIPPKPATSNKPFQRYIYTFNSAGVAIDSIHNLYHYNVWVDIYRKNAQGTFELVKIMGFPEPATLFYTVFTPLSREYADKPNGYSIDKELHFMPPHFAHGQELRIDVRVVDRAKNVSNLVSEYVTLRMQ